MRNQISTAIFYGNGEKYKSNSHRRRNTAAGQSKQKLSRNVSCMIRKTNTYTHVSDIKMRNWKIATKRSPIKVTFVL